MIKKALLLALSLSSLGLLAAPAWRVIDVDVARGKGPMDRMHNLCVGAGRANEGLRADWQRQLREVRAECGFRYIRFQGLFCEDLGVYQEDQSGRPVYDWRYVDELFDFLLSIGMKPFVELGSMPSGLAGGPHTIFRYRGNATPPRDYAKWGDLVAAFFRHVTERYGRDEVRSWYFEVWDEPTLLDEPGSAGTVFSPENNSITDGVKEVRAKIRASRLPGAEFHYTERSSSSTPPDPIHDSYRSPASILDKVHNTGGFAEAMSYWTFADIFEEAGPRMTPFHGGFGLLNYQDLRKPAFYAYQFLNRLGEHELVSSDPDSIVCRREDGSVQALFWDFTIPHPGPSVINPEYYVGDHPPQAKGAVQVQLSHLRPGAYRLLAYKVGYRVNDVQAAWRDLGSPSQLTRSQVQTLRQASSGQPVIDEKVIVGEDGRFGREFGLRENDVWLVELRPL